MALGRLLKAVRSDSKKYIKQGGFEIQITLSRPDGTSPTQLKGLHVNRNINFDPDEGNTVSAQLPHITIDESDLDTANYVYRNSSGDLNLLKHRVSVQDSSGSAINYIVSQQYHDRTLGVITCILERFRV